jgi:hypothetical protein
MSNHLGLLWTVGRAATAMSRLWWVTAGEVDRTPQNLVGFTKIDLGASQLSFY